MQFCFVTSTRMRAISSLLCVILAFCQLINVHGYHKYPGLRAKKFLPFGGKGVGFVMIR